MCTQQEWKTRLIDLKWWKRLQGPESFQPKETKHFFPVAAKPLRVTAILFFYFCPHNATLPYHSCRGHLTTRTLHTPNGITLLTSCGRGDTCSCLFALVHSHYSSLHATTLPRLHRPSIKGSTHSKRINHSGWQSNQPLDDSAHLHSLQLKPFFPFSSFSLFSLSLHFIKRPINCSNSLSRPFHLHQHSIRLPLRANGGRVGLSGSGTAGGRCLRWCWFDVTSQLAMGFTQQQMEKRLKGPLRPAGSSPSCKVTKKTLPSYKLIWWLKIKVQ